MQTKYKIIIAIFAIIFVSYFIQFLAKAVKKKENFTNHYFDDVEHYENKPNEKPYELRIFILDEIDKLNISDKTVKGNLMETLFSENSMKELEGLPKEDRVKKIKEVYEKTTKVDKVAGEKVPDNSIEKKIKAYFTNEVVDDLPVDESELKTKISKASKKLDTVIDSLTDLKKILVDTKEKYEVPVPTFGRKENIEGFENVAMFANF